MKRLGAYSLARGLPLTIGFAQPWGTPRRGGNALNLYLAKREREKHGEKSLDQSPGRQRESVPRHGRVAWHLSLIV